MMTIPAAAQRLDHTHFFRFGLLHGRPTSQFTCYERMQSQTVFPLDDVTLQSFTWSSPNGKAHAVEVNQPSDIRELRAEYCVGVIMALVRIAHRRNALFMDP
eukprot:TRINITY_DN1042_c0_g1_i11.p2 TRINITY_DN1042_c0_g1~~TRINITY_DN1042_c0_g1_i11.p2  ORF type:complete len:102 (+),score=1.87 TRINITY_DN1042_c0_g1_i11:123-428(+)